MKFLILFIAALASNQALAALGDEKGNGGDAVVCRDNAGGITSIEMFDYFEARVLRGMNIVLPDGESPEEIAIAALDALTKFSPRRVKEYKETIYDFSRNVRFVPALVDVPDSGHIILPKDCRIEQLIIQQTPQMPEDRRFLVAKELWDAMDATQKAGALLHEAFYTEAIGSGHKDSRLARYFHTRMVEVSAKDMTEQGYVELMKQVRYPFREFREITGLSREEMWEEMWCAISPSGFEFDPQGNAISLKNQRGHCKIDHPFLSGGAFQSFIFKVDAETGVRSVRAAALDASADITVHGQKIMLNGPTGGSVVAHSDGAIELIEQKTGSCYRDLGANLYFCGSIYIHANGVVRPRPLSSLEIPGWTLERIPSSAQVRVNRDGIYVFSGPLDGAVARYQKEPFDLRFSSLDKLGIAHKAGYPIPLDRENEDGLPMDPESTLLGKPFGDKPVLYYMHTAVPRGKNEYVQLGANYFYAAVQKPLALNALGQNFLSRFWGRNGGTQVASPETSLTFTIQGKRLASQPNRRVAWGSKGVTFFRYKKGSATVRLKGLFEKSFSVKGGDCIWLYDYDGVADRVQDVLEEKYCN